MATTTKKIEIDRVQTGLRIEKKMLKVLKGIAEYRDKSVGEMLELILLHSFENRPCFSKESLAILKDLKKIYGLDYGVHDYEVFVENKKNE